MLLKGEDCPPAALGSLLRPWGRGCHQDRGFPFQSCPSACQCQHGESGCLMTGRKEGLAGHSRTFPNSFPILALSPCGPLRTDPVIVEVVSQSPRTRCLGWKGVDPETGSCAFLPRPISLNLSFIMRWTSSCHRSRGAPQGTGRPPICDSVLLRPSSVKREV